MTEHTKRQVVRMLGEFLREVGLLVAVFSPLDLIITNRTLTPIYFINTLAIVGFCLALGVYLGVETDE